MSIELDRPGGGGAAVMLSVGTLLALEKNDTLANDELAGIVEESLARLKAIDAETSVRSQAAWGAAVEVRRDGWVVALSNRIPRMAGGSPPGLYDLAVRSHSMLWRSWA